MHLCVPRVRDSFFDRAGQHGGVNVLVGSQAGVGIAASTAPVKPCLKLFMLPDGWIGLIFRQ